MNVVAEKLASSTGTIPQFRLNVAVARGCCSIRDENVKGLRQGWETVGMLNIPFAILLAYKTLLRRS
jgi:hypothetical protein